MKATTLSRSGTLSWKQRPLSRGSNAVRVRAQSGTPPPSAHSTSSFPQNAVEEVSRVEIAASLSSKDPSWFRQTADRGMGSAALRRNDAESDRTTQLTSRAMRLPGMSEPGSTNNSPAEKSEKSPKKLPQEDHGADLDPEEETSKSETTLQRPDNALSLSLSKSPALELPTFKPLDLSSTDPDAPSLSRSSGILSGSGRPPSPTKGLGGFVQSAMMKRSDSVNKRWSVQANAGLRRGDSIASNRPANVAGSVPFTPGHGRTSSREPTTLRQGTASPVDGSRPASSHAARSLPHPPVAAAEDNNEAALDVGKRIEDRPSTPVGESNLARSPSKTLDPRRWSPTKASWLETALSKPESPRPAPPKPEPPAWKVNMQRSKSEKQVLDPKPDLPSSSDHLRVRRPLNSPFPSSSSNTQSVTPADLGSPTAKNPRGDVEAGKGTDRERSHDQASIGDHRLSSAAVDHVPKMEDSTVPATIEKESIEASRQASEGPHTPETTPSRKPLLKPKPQTPPKTDFRVNLKPRPVGSSANADTEPEFKSVFAKLKRTQTQNYVAPDELKGNIMKGKAALSVTGGPQKPKKVDEFKESILQQKEAMKVAGGSIHKRTESTSERTSADKSEPALPEALARRKTLHKTSVSRPKSDEKPVTDLKAPTAIPAISTKPQKPDNLKARSTVPVGQPSASLSDTSLKHKEPEEKSVTAAQSPPSDQDQLVSLSRRPIKADVLGTVSVSESPKPPENSTLAARLNPALAGLLSRGNGPRPAQGPSSTAPLSNTVREGFLDEHGEAGGSGGSLTHMTKGRAKGPKRRLPKAESQKPSSVADPKAKSISVAPKGASSPPSRSPTSGQAALGQDQPPSVSRPQHMPIFKQTLSQSKPTHSLSVNVPDIEREWKAPAVATEPDAPKIKPMVAAKSPELRKVSGQAGPPKSTEDQPPAKGSAQKSFEIASDHATTSNAPHAVEKTESPVTRVPYTPKPLTPSKSKVNAAMPSKPPGDEAARSVTDKPMAKVSGLGLKFNTIPKATIAPPELTPPPEGEKKLGKLAKFAASPDRARPNSPGNNLKADLEGFFGGLPHPGDKADFDTQAFLVSQEDEPDKIKTISKQIWEVTGDGKRSPMPPQQEHILFEESMYLCVHSFEAPNGSKSSEVYLWCGDEVPEAAIEDAQLFCRKIARENSAKLEVVKQGQESSRFFQALGGIVITRRSKSSALYMLCGRRYLGHVAFDEVDLCPSNLCSGFPFLISAKFGKLYLWKGRGSDAEEVGCARLIGMDLGLTGEIEEVTEGDEPATFWESFPSSRQDKHWSEQWRNRHKHNGYPCRLYRVEHDRPKSSSGFWGLRPSSPPKQPNKGLVEEIRPFSQKDLDASHIYILDAFAEVYV